MRIDPQLPYKLALEAYRQGLECDRAAGLIRKQLPQFLEQIKNQVKQEMGDEYKPEWER